MIFVCKGRIAIVLNIWLVIGFLLARGWYSSMAG